MYLLEDSVERDSQISMQSKTSWIPAQELFFPGSTKFLVSANPLMTMGSLSIVMEIQRSVNVKKITL